MSPQRKPLTLYEFSLMGRVSVGKRSLRLDMRRKVIKPVLIQERDTLKVQGFKEAKCSQRKALEKKAQDLGF